MVEPIAGLEEFEAAANADAEAPSATASRGRRAIIKVSGGQQWYGRRRKVGEPSKRRLRTHVKNGQKKVTHVRFEVGSFPEFKAQLQPPP